MYVGNNRKRTLLLLSTTGFIFLVCKWSVMKRYRKWNRFSFFCLPPFHLAQWMQLFRCLPAAIFAIDYWLICLCLPTWLSFAALKDAVRKAKLEEIRIPFGVGIAGMVAQTKEMINIKEAYKDARFNCEIDLKTGYKTNAILSMPICNYEGDVIGVAQIINKTNGKWMRNIENVISEVEKIGNEVMKRKKS